MQKIEIDLNKPLNAGDIVELHFKSLGLAFVQTAQIAIIKQVLSGNEFFEIVSARPEASEVVFTCRVKKTNPVVVTVLVIAAAIAGVGAIAWLTLDKAYQLVESPGSGIAFGSLGLIAVAVLAGLLLNVWRK